jgi:carbon monoxide dehydrogenase subunit G
MPRASATRSIHIKAAPEDVYDFALGDLSSLADWMTSVDKVEEADPSWPAIGSSYSYSRTVEKRTIRGKTTVLEAERPRRVVMREELVIEGAPAERQFTEDRAGRSIWTFEPEPGGTVVTMVAEGVEMKPLFYLLWRLLAAGRVRQNVDASLQSLKRICEEELEDASGEEA